MSDSVQPHRWQPNRLLCPWDSPGKNTGVGCHFPLQCMKVKSESEVAQSCPTLHDPKDCSPPGSSVHGILQARALEWDAIAFRNWELIMWEKRQDWANAVSKKLIQLFQLFYPTFSWKCLSYKNAVWCHNLLIIANDK